MKPVINQESVHKKRRVRKPNVALDKTTFIKSKVKAKEHNMSHVAYVEDALRYYDEKDRFLKRYAPHISKLGYHSEGLILRDARIPDVSSIEIKVVSDLKNPNLVHVFCRHDQSFDCDHVKFALLLPELVKLNVSKLDADIPVQGMQQTVEKLREEMENLKKHLSRSS